MSLINERLDSTAEYYGELRTPMLSLVEGVPQRVLEIGCASGQTLAYMKAHGAAYAVGVEYRPEVAALAKTRGLDEVLVGNIEHLTLPFEEASFDLLIAGHVLEHLVDPWRVLHSLRRFLKVGGQLVGALPNVRHHTVVIPLLLKGEWKYRQSGIMDWTHLRFFSRSTAIALLEDSGFKVKKMEPEFGRKSALANSLTGGVFRNFLPYAYNFSAFKMQTDGNE